MATLHLDSLVYRLNDKTQLNNVYLSLQTGDIVELIGSNGAGKSSLLEILFGTKKAQHYHLRIDNHLIRQRHHLSKYFAFKPQFAMFPKQLRLRDVLPTVYGNWPEFESKQSEPIYNFSTGIQQLIQTLFVLNLPQPFILLDEPFAGLSPLLQERLLPILQEKAQNKGILIVNHIPGLLSSIRTKQLQLHNGSLQST
ncbi:ATP-binding cassette domain-containing protein [Myroides sp. DF42-4-2]|uniref:ATP-binding cassette domain-containing protein n=1 Tax=unclassified Myroides TaxID=2642485 RepID=UPI002577C225|nr:ATP-binding cassette domain-containing protein [Myroides sp. DF42-4-2]MDM1407949.1 ATP-binding cassette domain-containing protein [Myroides sp. DF42-4-2]